MGEIGFWIMVTLVSLAFILPSKIESIMELNHKQQIELLQKQQCNEGRAGVEGE